VGAEGNGHREKALVNDGEKTKHKGPPRRKGGKGFIYGFTKRSGTRMAKEAETGKKNSQWNFNSRRI